MAHGVYLLKKAQKKEVKSSKPSTSGQRSKKPTPRAAPIGPEFVAAQMGRQHIFTGKEKEEHAKYGLNVSLLRDPTTQNSDQVSSDGAQLSVVVDQVKGNVALASPGDGPITVRTMIQSDAEFAARMSVEAFRGKYEWAVGKNRIEGLIQAETEAHSLMSDDYDRILIAEYEGQQAGLVMLKFPDDKDPDINVNYNHYIGCCGACGLQCMSCAITGETVPESACFIEYICVDASLRGKGIGKTLMASADYEARKRGCNRMILWVAQDNQARGLFEKHGYRVSENEDGWLVTWCPTGIRKWYKMEKMV